MDAHKIFDFLTELSKNNTREWFHEHKDFYLQAKNEVELFIDALGDSLVQIDPLLQGFISPEKSLFRIYRDIRFSKDKTPYKTHFGCFFVPGGKNSVLPGYYVHFEPKNTFVGGGIWCPEPNVLKKIRQEIFYNTDRFLEIINRPEFKKFYPNLDSEDMLKKNPSGFPVDFEHGTLLRHKHFTVSHPLDEQVLYSTHAEKTILDAFKALKPFNDFLKLGLE